MFFIYIPRARRTPTTTLRRATQARIQQQLPRVAAFMRENGDELGPAAGLYMATAQARLNPEAPVQVPQTATFQQLQFIDTNTVRLREDVAVAVENHSESYPVVHLLWSGVEVPVRVNVRDLRRILCLPNYNLVAPFNAPPTRPTSLPDELDMVDIDHASEQGEDDENEIQDDNEATF